MIWSFVFLHYISAVTSHDAFRDCQQITFVMLNGFCLLSNPLPPNPPLLNGQSQDGWNTNQNQLKNTPLFHIVFEVLKAVFIKICKMQPQDLLFLVALC